MSHQIVSESKLIIKDATLMSQGIWNNTYYDKNEIQSAFKNTDWEGMRQSRNLFLDHDDKKAREWIGEVDNIHFSNETLFGDLVVYDPIWIAKLKNGKPKIGISPKVAGMYDEQKRALKNFVFENFSLVVNPAVKTAFINNMEVMAMSEESIDEILESSIDAELKGQKPALTPDEQKKKKYPYPDASAEMDEEKILAKAKEILAKRKSEATTKAECMEDIFDLFELYSVKSLSVGDIAKKAKEIRKEGESWKDAIKRAASMVSGAKNEEVKSAEPKMEDVEKKELKETIDKLDKKVKELSEELNKPAKTTITLNDSKPMSVGNVDEGMLKFLQGFEGD